MTKEVYMSFRPQRSFPVTGSMFVSLKDVQAKLITATCV